MAEDPSQTKQDLQRLSSSLLAEAEAVKELEARKRAEPISTPDFHRLASEIEDRARSVFRLAHVEDDVGEELPTGRQSIDDVEREVES